MGVHNKIWVMLELPLAVGYRYYLNNQELYTRCTILTYVKYTNNTSYCDGVASSSTAYCMSTLVFSGCDATAP